MRKHLGGVEMARCGDCLYADFCEQIPSIKEFNRDNVAYCQAFKNKADVVEVVRCKDCKRYIKGNAGEQSNYCDCHTISAFEKFFCLPNDYCSCGERKDNNDR